MGIFNAEAQRRRVRREGFSRVERAERVERDGGFLTQRRRDAECGEGFSHVERVEGESVSQGTPSLRDGAKKGEKSHK